ncbi:MAG: toll/interleukin-1 receptor domain-containing protein [Cyanobacteria bacterium P01_D01_bin.156]
MAKKHVFLSYCRDNADEVGRLHGELTAAGESVWWDQDILPGQDWKLEIRKAMRDAYAVLLCLSKETSARTTSGIYPEALDAINMLRDYPPGDIFLIPVRLSECEIPMIEIDGIRTLDRLQFVDLFPDDRRDVVFQKLIRALRVASHHPPLSKAIASQSAAVAPQSATASLACSDAVAIWQEKLAFLQEQEAITVDPSQKFALKKQIEEAQQKNRELSE